jgi:hypothetical protein
VKWKFAEWLPQVVGVKKEIFSRFGNDDAQE